MLENTFAVGYLDNGTIVFECVDTTTKSIAKGGKALSVILSGGVFECENLKFDGYAFKYNGSTYKRSTDLINALKAAMRTDRNWLLVDKLTDGNGNVIGYGVLAQDKYLRAPMEQIMRHTDKFLNAFVRDGSLVNKCKETSESNMLNMIKKTEPVEKPVVAENKGILSGVGIAKPAVEMPKPVVPSVQVPKVEPTQPLVSTTNKLEIMKKLVDKLNEAASVYEQGEDEIMSNKEYDDMYDELMRLEGETGTILPNSPTQKVGYEVLSNLEKCTHDTPMLSLGKTKDPAELKAFLGQKEGVLSWKLDGLTVVFTFNNGILTKAVTRGNGYVGELVTNNAKTFINVPKRINYQGELVLRGEALISYADFEKIKATPEGADYKNPRNLCSGSVRQLDSGITARRNVRWVIFDWVNAPDNKDKMEQFDFIESLGFETVKHVKIGSGSVDAAIEAFSKAVEKNPYPSDGLVLTYNDVAYGKSLGNTAKTPRHSIAFKWQDEEAETRLINIEWTVGRSGVITPTAVFEPVDLEGTTVQKASLHNISIMEQVLGRPYVGQKIWVYKANMIIPQVSRAEKYTGTEGIPNPAPVNKQESLLKLTDDPRVTRMGNLNQWTVQFEGDELVFHDYDEAVRFADENGL